MLIIFTNEETPPDGFNMYIDENIHDFYLTFWILCISISTLWYCYFYCVLCIPCGIYIFTRYNNPNNVRYFKIVFNKVLPYCNTCTWNFKTVLLVMLFFGTPWKTFIPRGTRRDAPLSESRLWPGFHVRLPQTWQPALPGRHRNTRAPPLPSAFYGCRSKVGRACAHSVLFFSRKVSVAWRVFLP